VTSLFPAVLGAAGLLYVLAALSLGSWLLWTAWQAVSPLTHAVKGSDRGAQRLFLASVGYLPLVLGIMVVDKTFL